VTAYTTTAVAMAVLVCTALVLLGRSWTQRPAPPVATDGPTGTAPVDPALNAP
jgi:hypothetical protein